MPRRVALSWQVAPGNNGNSLSHSQQIVPSNETWIAYIYCEAIRSGIGLQQLRTPVIVTTDTRQLGWIDSHQQAGPFILFPDETIYFDAVSYGLDGIQFNITGFSYKDWEDPPVDRLPQPLIHWQPNSFRAIDVNQQEAFTAGITLLVSAIDGVKYILCGYEIILPGNAIAAVASNFIVDFHDGINAILRAFKSLVPAVYTVPGPYMYTTGWVPVEIPIIAGRGFGVSLSHAITGGGSLLVVYQLVAIPAIAKTLNIRPLLSSG